MNIIDLMLLFIIMAALAIIPSTSVALVVTRSATAGFANGIAVAAGIVLGDLVFVILAILGLSVIAENMAGVFIIIKYIGGTYLLWLGFSLLTSENKNNITANKASQKGGFLSSFIAGVVLTLGDVKAIFFYISLFPAFVDLSKLRIIDVFMVIIITIIAVGGVKIFYAFSAKKVVSISQNLKLEGVAKKTAGAFMVGAGGYLIVKA